MKWARWLVAVGLLPCLAYAASLTVPLTVQVTGGTAPSPPPQAAAAGFTTLALNADFSLPKYANATNNSWLCNRATDDGSHACEWYDGVWWNVNFPLDGVGANTIGQVFDSTIGQNVLEMSWDPSYCPGYFLNPRQCTAPFNVIETVSYKDQGEALTPQLATAFPANNVYVEWRYRDNEQSITNGNTTSDLTWWPRCGANSNNCSSIGQTTMEVDVVENWANACNVPDPAGTTSNCNSALQACHMWGPGDCNGSPRGSNGDSAAATWVASSIGDPEFNTYQTYGILITSSGVVDATGFIPFQECSYKNNTLVACIPGHTGAATNRNFLELAGGMATSGQLAAGTFRQHVFHQYIRVWTCAAWNTTEPARQCNQNPPPPQTTPIAYWSFDSISGTTVADSSGSGHAGTTVGGPTTVPGQVGQALSLNGTSQYMTVSGAPSGILTPSRTILGWFNTTSFTSGVTDPNCGATAHPHYIYSDTKNGYGLDLFTREDGTLKFDHWSSANNVDVLTSSALSANTNIFFAATFDQTTVRLYINGVQVASAPAASANTYFDSATPRLGGGTNCAATPFFFPGWLDEMRVYNRALSAAEVMSAFNGSPP